MLWNSLLVMRCGLRPSFAACILVLGSACGHIAISTAEEFHGLEAPSATTALATMRVDEILSGIVRSSRNIRALDADFTDLVRSRSSDHGSDVVIPYSFRRSAFKGEKRYSFSKELKFPHKGDLAADIAARPEAGDYARAFDGQLQRFVDEAQGRGGILEAKDGSADSQILPFLLGVQISDEVRAWPLETKIWARSRPDVYEASGLNWTVEPLLQEVEGIRCHVITEPHIGLRLWIDPALGFAVRFEETQRQDPATGAATPDVEFRSIRSDFRKVGQGIWLPHRIAVANYAGSGKAAGQPPVAVGRRDIVVTRMAVNDDVPDALFDLKFHPGTTVSDTLRDVVYVVGENGEELDHTVVLAKEVLGSRPTFRYSIWLWLNAAIVTLIAAALAWRRLAKRGSGPRPLGGRP